MGKWRMFVLIMFLATWVFMFNLASTVMTIHTIEDTFAKAISEMQEQHKKQIAQLKESFKIQRGTLNQVKSNMELYKSMFPNPLNIVDEPQFWHWDNELHQLTLYTPDFYLPVEGP
jgi:hypothetical protein